MNHPRTWFTAKASGLGWKPATWEGWGVLAAIVVVAFIVSRVAR